MAQQRRTTHASSRSPKSASREWIGGRFSAPCHITEGPEPYRPTLVVWLEAPAGFVVGHDLPRPGTEDGALGRALKEALQHPLVGLPRRPSKIRVADSGLAAEVKAVVGDLIPVTIAATPELDELVDSMFDLTTTGAEHSDDDIRGVETASYFGNGRVSPAAVDDLFAAARMLHFSAPWKIASDRQVLRLDIPELGVEGACVSIIGALGESMGILIFPSLGGFDSFLKAASGPRRKSKRIDLGTSWLSFMLVPGTELPNAMRREVKKHGWPVMGEHSYPQVEHRDRDLVLRPLTERDVSIAAACATSLSAFFTRNHGAFEADEGEPICQTYTDDQGRTVRFTLPYEALPLFDVGPDSQPKSRASTPASVGRNDLCHCGSGKKYKKCHLGEDQTLA